MNASRTTAASLSGGRWLWLLLMTMCPALGRGDAMAPPRAASAALHPVPREHPRLFGSRQRLQQLARERADAYRRVVSVARQQQADEWSKLVSLSLVCAIEQDAGLGRQAIEQALQTIRGPIRVGHETFGHDLARCAVVYDLCHEHWTPDERTQFHDYLNRTIAANVQSETHVFHNAWYGYKNWGIGLACYATFYENPRAEESLRTLEQDYQTRAAPALELAGDGGSWAEGYYIHYWLYEWLVFCEAARFCEGVDHYAAAPKFYGQRAVAGMFETYPGIDGYRSRRPVPMGDGGGRLFGGDRDKELSSRRILVNRFRDDPDHQAVHAFNETTPRSSVGVYAYKDFLWRDTSVSSADLKVFRLAHVSPGPGYVFARSSWDEDATYFFFKCGDRFTAHQHLDVGHFVIYRQTELAGDGGHYDGFGTLHDVNYHLRTIAHSTILVHDPAEQWPAIRAGRVTGNDGGQRHNWPHHNGAVSDAAAWQEGRLLYDIGDLVAFEDAGEYVYVAADCSKAYAPVKLESFTRQMAFVRPGTFLVLDRVVARDPDFKKTWLLQAMSRPLGQHPSWTITNGAGRLFVQTLLPRAAEVRLQEGENLYRYGNAAYPPQRDTGPAPQCRIEISPAEAAREDWFLHVLTAADASVESVDPATAKDDGAAILVQLGRIAFRFDKNHLGGSSEVDGQRRPLAAGMER
ncbi:MAG: heparinase II/III-family protein [Pirellulaceae bacterium]|nr:heparinase II/III-family protein [Pirellulaceae bacterium]